MEVREGTLVDLLPDVQALATRLWTPESWAHAGQLAWSSAFTDPDSAAAIWSDGGVDVAACLLDGPELVVDPAHEAVAAEVIGWAQPADVLVLETEQHLVRALADLGFAADEAPYFRQHLLDLRDIEVPTTDGYTLRPVAAGETAARAACHRAAWSDVAPSSMTTEKYDGIAGTAPYDRALDWVATDAAGEMVASCLVWLAGEVALVEPVGCAPEHRGRGLAGAVSLAALAASRDHGATTGLVRPRGDTAYPVPQRVYRGIGFRPGARTRTFVRHQEDQ
ncbi:MAG: GCN5 family acetyltransferase [Nocardioides sp.]|nr:GCN5 family acetyltransferase [Nocardioides sp.]